MKVRCQAIFLSKVEYGGVFAAGRLAPRRSVVRVGDGLVARVGGSWRMQPIEMGRPGSDRCNVHPALFDLARVGTPVGGSLRAGLAAGGVQRPGRRTPRHAVAGWRVSEDRPARTAP